MCWSGEASTVWAIAGFSASAYAAYKKEDPRLYIPLIYFSMMEALQAYTYSVIDQCALPQNQVATYLGYLHIAFQPFFINAASMYFIPKHVRQKIEIPIYAICFAAAIFMLIQVYPFAWAGMCELGRQLCAERMCSVSGNWHIAWEIPVNGIGNDLYRMGLTGYLAYVFSGFIVPILYGSWRFTVYHIIMGPFLAGIMTDNVNERPAVWCLLSIGFLMIVLKTPVRKWLFTKKSIWFRGSAPPV